LKVKCDSEGIKKASDILRDGGIAIFPTDTVYGVGCDPFKKKSVDRIYKIKNRPKSKPFPVLIHSMDEATQIAQFDFDSLRLAKKFWPGPLTLIVPLNDKKLGETLEIKEKIALRIPNNKCLLDLLDNCKFLIGTSANISGEHSFTNSDECYKKMNDFDIFLDGGNLDNKGESTILEINDGKPIIHRSGALKEEEILEIF
jgi:L-threonylcarbamoyladenylate synthase